MVLPGSEHHEAFDTLSVVKELFINRKPTETGNEYN